VVPDDEVQRAQRLLEEQAAELESTTDELERTLLFALEDRARAAEEGEQRVREILASITDGFYALDAQGRFTYVNAQLERITGRSRDALLGRVAWEVFELPADSLPRRKYEEARRTGLGQVYEAYVERIDRWLEFRSFPGPTSHSVFIRDVTEQRRRDEALRKSEERWRLVGQATADLMYDWDIASGALYFSESLRTVYGHEAAQPRIEWWEAQIHPDDREAAAADLQRAVDAGDASWEHEYRFRRADGSWVVVLDRGAFVRDGDGRAMRMVGSMQDVTARRLVEQQLLQAQKMEVMGQLAAGVAHDFNNLLTAMFGYLELADEMAADGVAVTSELAEVRRAAEQAAALTRQLLVFSRRELERPRSIDLGIVLGDAERLLARLIGGTHALDLRVAAGLWPVRLDPVHAEQVLMNLVLNARDAMPDGGPVIVALDNVTLEAPIAEAIPAPLAAGAYVRLVVRDSGVGMDARTLSRVWEPFFTTKSAGRGTGLGLPTVRSLVARAGGGIVVESMPGRGTTFAVYLPRGTSPAEPRATNAPPQGGSERVLLIEDEPAVRDAVQRALERHGYSVAAPDDVDAAVRRLHTSDGVDVVVLDAQLDVRRRGAVESVLAALRARPLPTPLVLLAGVVRDGPLAPAAGRPGIVVEKPFATEALLRALRQAIERD
jgi:PAS domain S-box-containing protein